METYNTYRLTGLAFVLLDNNCVRFCLDTFYKGRKSAVTSKTFFNFITSTNFIFFTLLGQYFEPYYIEVQITDEKIKVELNKYFIWW